MEIPKLSIPKPKFSVIGMFSKFQFRLVKLFMRLNWSQRLFLISTVLLMLSEDWALPCLLIMLALSLEFWPKFVQLWHSLPGKGLLLFCYAIIANFALASAASVINEITGVSAGQLPYSHNFAILLYLPLWLIGFTVIALLLLQMLLPFYLMMLLLLKPFGVRAVKLISNIAYPVTTGIFRLVLAAIVLIQLFLYFESEIEQAGDELNIEIGLTINNKISNDAKPEAQTEGDEPKLSNRKKHYEDFVISSLNQFIYEMESDQYSRCQISEQARAIELNDYEILEISKDPANKKSYLYQVKKCISPALGHKAADN